MRVSTSNTISLVNGQNIAVKKLYNTNDIVKTVLEVYSDHYSQAADLAAQLKDPSIKKTCKNIYDFIRSNIKYIEDGTEKQIVAAPARLLQKKSGDCKSMTVLAASILKCLNIPHLIRFVGYKDSGTPNQYTHVYVIVPTGSNTYITIDPVHHKFNSEVSGISIYRDYPKNQSKKKAYMNGYSVGQTRWQRFRASAGQKTKTVTLVPARAAFLGLLRINALGLASLLKWGKDNQSVDYTKARDKWYKAGGNRTEFDRVVDLGSGFRPIGSNMPIIKNWKFVDNLRKKGIISGHASIGAVDPVTLSSLITAATGIIIFLLSELFNLSDNVSEPKFDDDGKVTNWDEIIKQIAAGKMPSSSTKPLADTPNYAQLLIDEMKTQNEEKAKKDNTLIIGGAALAAIAFFLVPTIKGKK